MCHHLLLSPAKQNVLTDIFQNKRGPNRKAKQWIPQNIIGYLQEWIRQMYRHQDQILQLGLPYWSYHRKSSCSGEDFSGEGSSDLSRAPQGIGTLDV
ncbi:hypothetical protein ACFX19_047322 [Malus domestica]